MNSGFTNVIPVLDNKEELDDYSKLVRTKEPLKLGIRIAAEEEPTFDFYTSRLSVAPRDILEFYVDKLKGNPKFEPENAPLFMNKGSRTIYFTGASSIKC